MKKSFLLLFYLLLFLPIFAYPNPECGGLFSGIKTPLQKAFEINLGPYMLIMHVVGSKKSSFDLVREAYATGEGLHSGHIYHAIEASRDYYANGKSGPSVSELRVTQMLEKGLNEYATTPESSFTPFVSKKEKRPMIFAETAVTKDGVLGYMWMGVVIQLPPANGGERPRYLQARLQLNLLNTNNIGEQSTSVANIGINLIHTLKDLTDLPSKKNIIDLVGKLHDNIKSREVAITTISVDLLSVTKTGRKDDPVQTNIKKPLLDHLFSKIELAQLLFKHGFANELIVGQFKDPTLYSKGAFIDNRAFTFNSNVFVFAEQNVPTIAAGKIDVGTVKKYFDQSPNRGTKDNTRYVLPLSIESALATPENIRELNNHGIHVWLFKSRSVNEILASIREKWKLEEFSRGELLMVHP